MEQRSLSQRRRGRLPHLQQCPRGQATCSLCSTAPPARWLRRGRARTSALPACREFGSPGDGVHDSLRHRHLGRAQFPLRLVHLGRRRHADRACQRHRRDRPLGQGGPHVSREFGRQRAQRLHHGYSGQRHQLSIPFQHGWQQTLQQYRRPRRPVLAEAPTRGQRVHTLPVGGWRHVDPRRPP